MIELTWASHPNATLRLRLAHYLGRGWTIERLEAEWAIVTRPKPWTNPAAVILNPFYVRYAGRRKRVDRMRISIGANDEVLETRC